MTWGVVIAHEIQLNFSLKYSPNGKLSNDKLTEAVYDLFWSVLFIQMESVHTGVPMPFSVNIRY